MTIEQMYIAGIITLILALCFLLFATEKNRELVSKAGTGVVYMLAGLGCVQVLQLAGVLGIMQ